MGCNHERRRHARSQQARAPIHILTRDKAGAVQRIGGKILDISEHGIGISCLRPLAAGAVVTIAGQAPQTDARAEMKARVAYCSPQDDGRYRAGLELEDHGRNPFGDPDGAAAARFVDYYEMLQLSPNASASTVHRVYRFLAQQYHPDNKETGHEETFKQILEAYRVLGDPQTRAAYDIHYAAGRRARWKMFNHLLAVQGVEAEKKKRQGILELLYKKRICEPDHPGLTVMEIEDLLGCSREHLECSLWYLREAAFARRTDDGKWAITIKGFDQVEKGGALCLREDRLLTAAAH
jgi:curved DNA-binding protein